MCCVSSCRMLHISIFHDFKTSKYLTYDSIIAMATIANRSLPTSQHGLFSLPAESMLFAKIWRLSDPLTADDDTKYRNNPSSSAYLGLCFPFGRRTNFLYCRFAEFLISPQEVLRRRLRTNLKGLRTKLKELSSKGKRG